MTNKKPYIIAIDGRCAAGKTTFAQKLSEIFACSVIHMDHFFLRPEQRTQERLNEPGGNVDLERFCEEVVESLKTEKDFTYRIFDCRQMRLTEEIKIQTTSVVIIEGAYCCHPKIRDNWDLTIFMDVDREEQLLRIKQRNGIAQIPVFQERWIPMEEAYFKTFQVKESCRLTLRQPMPEVKTE